MIALFIKLKCTMGQSAIYLHTPKPFQTVTSNASAEMLPGHSDGGGPTAAALTPHMWFILRFRVF
jgi:hypothetical protein